MFNILLESMPTKVLGCEIRTDVSTCIRALELIDDVLIEDELRGAGLLHLMFYKNYPADIGGALSGLISFLSCNTNKVELDSKSKVNSESELDSQAENSSLGDKEKAFDYLIDNNVIYSSLKSYYGYNLDISKLHWWEFNILLLNMKDTPFNDLVHYRTVEINKLPEYQRAEYRSIRNKVRLPKKVDEEYIENIKLLYPDDWKERVQAEVEKRRQLIN